MDMAGGILPAGHPATAGRTAILSLLLALPACASTQRHQTYADGRCGDWPPRHRPAAEDREFGVFDRIDVTPSGQRWNGKPTDLPALDRYLAIVPQLNPQPVVVLVVEDHADCARVVALRRLMDARLHCAPDSACAEYPLADWAARAPFDP